MHSRTKIACLIAVAIACCGGAANAQAVVHAIGGTLTAVSPDAKTVTMTTDDGSSASFNLSPTMDTKLNFDDKVRAETTTPQKLKADGSHVILYFIWNNDARTAVAVQSLGAGPFEKVTGTVLKFDKHDHDLMLRTADGKTETVLVGDKTVVDTEDGIGEGQQFHAGKGDHVRLLASSKNGSEEALFIRTEGLD
jgi:hypothetical protein